MKIITEKDILAARSDLDRVKMLIKIITGEVKYKSEKEKKMNRISVIDTRVQELLEQFPDTRENDHLLYVVYIETYHFLEFSKRVFINYKEYDVPPFSSIERSARDIRNKHANLKGSAKTQENRNKGEAEYRKHYGECG